MALWVQGVWLAGAGGQPNTEYRTTGAGRQANTEYRNTGAGGQANTEYRDTGAGRQANTGAGTGRGATESWLRSASYDQARAVT